ncbi:beta-phosphoglucomutase [Pseudoxanthomonas kalamensis DSM 18571]|nr:beta-phosphoglucomutase [Pseudoxanthomonas kalamensis DSM 18571]
MTNQAQIDTGANATTGAIDPWRLCRDGYDPVSDARDQTLFALANGSLGVRAGLEEGGRGGSFMAGVYERHPIHYHERFPGFARHTDTRLPVADGARIGIWLDEERVDPGRVEWLRFRRELDLRDGRLTRRARLRTPQGRTLDIVAERVVPTTTRPGAADLLAIRYRVESVDYDGPLTLVSALESGQQAAAQGDDPRIGVSGGEGLITEAGEASEVQASLRQRTRHSGIHLVCAQRHGGDDMPAYDGSEREPDRVAQRYRVRLQPGQGVTLEKYVAYACGDSSATLHERADEALREAMSLGFDGLARRHAEGLHEFWQAAELGVGGDPASEQALRFNLFHLLQSAAHDGVHGTAAKGLTGEGYEGHCFWDTEAFVLPVMALTAPDIARAMLMYRHRTLDAARAHAREMNHDSGALYAWRTIAGGECSAHYPSGSAAYHINAAIAYAIGMYFDASGDVDFLAEAGAEMLFETARVWMQIGHFNPHRDNRFCIHEVTGPDEYTTLVDNNYYTNRMAQRHLQRAAQVWQLLQEQRPDAIAGLARQLRVDADEVANWQRAADTMYLPYDEALGVHAQDDTFLDKPRWPHPLQQGEHRPLLLDYHPLTLYRYQVCKQADVVMALVLAGDGIDAASKRRDFDYYEAITTHDSTLSASVFGILAGEVGHPARAWHYFDAGLRVDLDDLHRNTDHGVHMAALAGSWLGLAQGFGGLRVVEGELHFHPRLPAAWQSYRFGLRWRGSALRVEVDASGVHYTLTGQAPLRIRHAGRVLDLLPGQSQVIADELAETAVFPRQCRALIFDLDGVLTDTASTHYRAWKRLADEIGVPFDRKVNERLKGVDRMASLEIILERAERGYSDEEKQALAARKNTYYVAEIEHVTPADLFEGVERLLAEARARGLKLGLASASRNAAALLQRLGIADRFDYVADAARIRNAKPDPEIFLTVANALGVAPAQCIGVEDAAAGIVAIRDAGMPAVGIGDPVELAQADRVLPSLAAFRLEDFVLP